MTRTSVNHKNDHDNHKNNNKNDAHNAKNHEIRSRQFTLWPFQIKLVV